MCDVELDHSRLKFAVPKGEHPFPKKQMSTITIGCFTILLPQRERQMGAPMIRRSIYAIGILGLSGLLVANYARAKDITVKPVLTGSPEAKAAKASVFRVFQWDGCVRQVGLFCKYVTINGQNYSAAVPSETIFGLFLPGINQYSAAAISPDTQVSAASATLGWFSFNCLFAPVPNGVTGAVVVKWVDRSKSKSCPKQ